MADGARTFLVECYLPGVTEAQVAAADGRARAAAAALQQAGRAVEYLGATLLTDDETVFHAFRASDAGVVGEASRAAGLDFARIVESVAIRGEDPTDEHAAMPVARTEHGR